MSPLDETVSELYQMYSFCKAFNCSPAEYEARPYRESQWLLEIEKVYNEAQHDAQERASQKAHNTQQQHPPRR